MGEIAKRKNLVGQGERLHRVGSGPRASGPSDDLAPIINHTLSTVFGPDRVMFGGDWPVCLLGVEKYADWLNALKTVVKDRPDAEQKRLFHDNAVKFYSLS